MEKQKKKTSKDILFNDISSSTKKITSAGAAQIPNLTPKQYADKLLDDSDSLWENPKVLQKESTESVPGTDIVPGTESVPSKKKGGTESVPGTDIVPDTENVPGTVYAGTESVPTKKKGDTESVPGTVYAGTDIVPGTESVPGTDIVPGTESVPLFLDALINTLSNTERVITLKRIAYLPVSPTSKLVLIILLNTINKAKQKVSLRSISKEYKLRWSTLLESLSSLEEKEIIKANHKKDGTIIDLSEFLTGTLSVPVNMYVCSMLNIINNTNNKQTDGTESVPVDSVY
jgi:DNA-binding transcriptional ArsR family regulator